MGLNPGGTLNPEVLISTTLDLTGPTNLGWYSFVDGDATPDISAGTFFKTANTAPTSITDFDGNSNAWIVVRAGDDLTTIVHDPTKINLEVGLDITLAAPDILEFVDDNGVWYEKPMR